MTAAATTAPRLGLLRDPEGDVRTLESYASHWHNRDVVTADGGHIVGANVVWAVECDGTSKVGRRESHVIPEQVIDALTPGIKPRDAQEDRPLEALDPHDAVVPTGYAVKVDYEHEIEPGLQRPWFMMRSEPFTVAAYQVADLDLWIHVFFASEVFAQRVAARDISVAERLASFELASSIVHEFWR